MTTTTPAPGTAQAGTRGLIVRGVSKRFGATQALHSIDLEVGPGEVVALLGENGAGKSTLSNIVAGVFPSDTGHMEWDGQPYAPAAPADALNAGIGLIHQEMRLLPDLTVSENVFVGRQLVRGGRSTARRWIVVPRPRCGGSGSTSHPAASSAASASRRSSRSRSLRRSP